MKDLGRSERTRSSCEKTAGGGVSIHPGSQAEPTKPGDITLQDCIGPRTGNGDPMPVPTALTRSGDGVLVRSVSSLDELDHLTESLGRPPGDLYRTYLLGDHRSTDETLHAANRLETFGAPRVRQAHAYFLAAKRAEHPSLAAACATQGARCLLRDGRLRSGLKVVDYLFRWASSLPAEDHDGFEGDWRILRAGIYNALDARGQTVLPKDRESGTERAFREYETVFRLPNGSPAHKAEAAFDMAALYLRDQRIGHAHQWFEVAGELADLLSVPDRERIRQAITINLANISLLSDPAPLASEREEIEQLVRRTAHSQDRWTQQFRDTAEVFLGRSLLAEGKLDETLTRLNRVSPSSWHAGQAHTYAAMVHLLKGEPAEARALANLARGEMDGERARQDILLWKAQALTILILCDRVQAGGVDPSAPTLQHLYDVCACWPSIGVLGSRRPGVLGMLEAFMEPKGSKWADRLLAKWLLFDILGIPPEVYQGSRLSERVP